jgi:AraC-like DNA-binding protein
MTGTITKTAIHHWKWQLGTGQNPFESEYTYPHDKIKWFNELRKFTVQYQLKVNIEENEYPLQRDNDKYIMELAEELGFSPYELRFLNHYRLFLNVISLSDIVNESGRSIDPTVTNFKKLPGKQPSDICIQQKPDQTKWSIWFRFIT